MLRDLQAAGRCSDAQLNGVGETDVAAAPCTDIRQGCDSMVASGFMSCAVEFSPSGTMAGSCDRTCGFCDGPDASQTQCSDLRDGCANTIATGFVTCAEDFCAGTCPMAGQCDRTCGVCRNSTSDGGRHLQTALQCDLADFGANADLVNTKCCDDGVSCSGGVPSKCDAKCALTYVPFFDRCSPILATQVATSDMRSYQRLYDTCSTGLEVEPLLRAAAACATPPPSPPHIGEDDCVSSPCQNGGGCFDGDHAYACACTDSYYGLNCESQVPPPPPPPGGPLWILAESNQDCDTECAAAGHGCVSGDWGVHDEAAFVSALLSAGLDQSHVDTRCSGGFEADSSTYRPAIFDDSHICKWRSGTGTSDCGESYSGSRLCKCAGSAPATGSPLSSCRVGDTVQIIPGTRFYHADAASNPSNPGGIDGVITSTGCHVDWSNGNGNGYSTSDLFLIRAASTTSSPFFTTVGDCYSGSGGRSGACIHSLNHMSGDNYESGNDCTATVHGTATLHTNAFHTESCCDHLQLGGNQWSGSSGPSDRTVHDGDEITWHTDSSVVHTGWELCLQ